MSCIFCKIVNKEIPSQIVYEDDNVLAFNDINPQAPVHVIVIPKIHISSVNEITTDNSIIVANIFNAITNIVKSQGINDTGYRVITNCGNDGCQSVGHLHFHILGGKKLSETLS